MKINNKTCFILITLISLTILLSAVSAADTNNTLNFEKVEKTSDTNVVTTESPKNTEKTQIAIQNNKEVQQTTDKTTSQLENNKKVASTQDKITTHNKTQKNLKTATQEISINTYNDLKNNIASASGKTKTLSLKNNITLGGNLVLKGTNSLLTINGNGYIIDGDTKYQFIRVNPKNKLVLNNVIIINCYTEDNGGAIDNYGTTVVKDSKFFYNEASVGGVINNRNQLTVTNSVFINNAGSFFGGAISTHNIATIENCDFIYNVAQSGGAIFSDANRTETTTTTIRNCTFSKNQVKDAGSSITSTDGRTKIYKSRFTDGVGPNTIYSESILKNVTLIIDSSFFNETKTKYIQLSNDTQEDITNDVYISNNTFVGQKVSTKITLNVLNINSKNTTVKVTGINFYNKTLNEGIVTLYANNKKTSKSMSNGQATIIFNISPGKHDLKAVYESNNMYASSSDSKTITVPKINTTLTTEILKKTVKDTTLHITVKAADGSKTTGNVSIVHKGKVLLTKALVNGTNTYVFELPEGKQDVEVKYLGNSMYVPTSKTYSITTTKTTVGFTTYILKKTTNNITFKVMAYDTNKTKVPGKISIVNKNGTTLVTQTLTNGECLLTFNLPAGKQSVEVKYLGDKYYKAASKAYTFEVSKVQTGITTYILNSLTSNTTFKVMVSSADKSTVNGNVAIISNDKTLLTKALTNGECLLTFKLPAGKQNITVKYLGNNIYNSKTKVYTVNVKDKVPVTITTYILKKTTSNTTFKVMVNGTDKTRATGNVAIINNGKTLLTKALTNGECLLTFSLPAGKQSVEVKYLGDTKYSPASKTYTFDVSDITPVTITTYILKKTTSNTTFKVMVNGTDKTRATGNVAIINNGKTLLTKALTNGECLLTFSLPAGKQSVEVKYLGDTKYLPASKTYTFDVTQVNPLKTVDTTFTLPQVNNNDSLYNISTNIKA